MGALTLLPFERLQICRQRNSEAMHASEESVHAKKDEDGPEEEVPTDDFIAFKGILRDTS